MSTWLMEAMIRLISTMRALLLSSLVSSTLMACLIDTGWASSATSLSQDWIIPEQDLSDKVPLHDSCNPAVKLTRNVIALNRPQSVRLTFIRVGSYRCNVDLVMIGDQATVTFRSTYWYGYENGAKDAPSRTVSIALIMIGNHPTIAIRELKYPAAGSCGGCGNTTSLIFLVLRDSLPPDISHFESNGDHDLNYSIESESDS